MRQYQQEAIQATVSEIHDGNRQVLVVLPTGSGKTIVATGIQPLLRDHGKLLFLVHRDELAHQAEEKFKRFCPGITVGIEKAAYRCMPENCDVVIASVQTLSASGRVRLSKFNPKNFWIMTDEAHHGVSNSYL